MLKGQGYTIIRMGRTLKVTTIDKAKKSNIPVHFGADVNDIAETDDIITQIVPVRSVDAVKLKTDLQPLVGEGADLASNGGQQLDHHHRHLGQHPPGRDDHRQPGQEGRARERHHHPTAEVRRRHRHGEADHRPVQGRLLQQRQWQRPAGRRRVDPRAFFRGGGFGGGGGGFGGGGGGGGRGGGGGGGGGNQAAEDKGRTGTVLAEADTRTNTVVITGPTDTLTVIENVLKQLDNNPITDQTFFLYKVKNGTAADIAATVNTLFGASISSGTSSNNRSSSSASSNRLGSSGSSSGIGSSFGSSSGGGGSGSSGSFGSSSSSSGRSSSSSSNNRSGTSGGGGRGAGSAVRAGRAAA